MRRPPCPARKLVYPRIADMTDPTARAALQFGAGLLGLLGLFRDNQTGADHYAAACLKKAKRH